MTTIKLSEVQMNSLSGADSVVVTGKANGNTVYFGVREIVIKVEVDRSTYKALTEGVKLRVAPDALVLGKEEPVKQEKSNPPMSMVAHRFPK